VTRALAREILRRYRTIAVVGASNDPMKPAGYVPAYLLEHGLRVIPVNPTETEVLGETSYPDLASVPEPVEVVDIFRPSEDVPPVVDAAIEAGAKAIWMQQGIRNEEAAQKARDAGLEVVQDLCMKTELRYLIKDGEWESPGK
jgi:predicted CoA-binding protein